VPEPLVEPPQARGNTVSAIVPKRKESFIPDARCNRRARPRSRDSERDQLVLRDDYDAVIVM
jgi:hypothetical protein